jgi:hypothetical protein
MYDARERSLITPPKISRSILFPDSEKKNIQMKYLLRQGGVRIDERNMIYLL